MMASLWDLQGGFTRFCDRGFDIGSPCAQRIVIDVLNLLFVIAFCLVLVVGRKHHINRGRSRNWVFFVTSACCVVSSIAYLGAGLLDVFGKNDGAVSLDWVGYLVRGFFWMALAVSLNIQRTKWGRILSSVWWINFSVLISALNVEVLLKSHSVRILDMASWPVNILLLYCSYDSFTHLISKNNQNRSLSQPLLIEVGESKEESPKASFISRLAFSWINPLLRLGYSRPLILEDIPPLESEDEACFAYEAFAHEWDLQRKQSSNTSNLVLRALAKCYMKEMVLIGVMAFLRTVAVVASPLLLYAFVSYSARKEQNLYYGLMLVGCMIFVKIVESLSQRHWFFGSRRFGMRMRSALMVAIFRKSLKLSSSGRRKHSTGEIVNYIAVDAYRLGEFPWWFHTAWTLPLQLVLAIGVLFGTVGMGALPGLVPLIICGFLNIPLARFRQKCQSKFMEAQDRRLRATSEVLNNMKIIKLQSWEEKFKNLIDSVRDVEFKWLAESQIKKSYGTALYWMSPMFVSSVVLAGCVVMRSAPFNASTIFTVLATLRVMSEPAKMLPEALSVLIQVKVSLDRLNIFLLDDELKEEDVKTTPHQDSHFSVRVHGGFFSWDPDTPIPTLKGVDLEARRGQKIAICGPVGAGKSSLLYALVGEIPKISGSVEIFGSIAYVSQTAWIQSGTIRDNILFGKQMNQGRYKEAIKVCALDKDIDSFDHGDLTEIGQRGLNLSGGQKQRLQLARAFYNDADIYLLDDPFSAVDAHTAATLFNDCVKVALKEKTVILVTHQVEFLAGSDNILVMRSEEHPHTRCHAVSLPLYRKQWSKPITGIDLTEKNSVTPHVSGLISDVFPKSIAEQVIEGGQVTQSGSYTELLKAGTAFEQLVNAHHDAMTVLDSANMVHISEARPADGDQMDIIRSPSTKENSEGEISPKRTSTIQLTEDEEKEKGDVGWKPYIDYVRVSKGSILLASFIFFQTAFVVLQAASSYWLAIAVQIPHIASAVAIGVYAGISAFSGIFVYLRIWFAAHLGLKASKAFFSGLMNSVFNAPMLFFDSTPLGRILTRASSDMSVLDLDIPFALAFALSGVIDVVTTILVMATVTWQVLFVAVPIILAARYFQVYYLANARELIRINGTTKAPVMNYAAETSVGVVTIRAFATMERFIDNNLKLLDTDASLFFHTNAAMEWVLLRVEALQNLTIFTATLLLVLLPAGTIAPGLVGLSLSYALTLTSAQAILTRWHCNLENYIISVERIKQYMHIPSEPPAIIDDKRPPPSWPFDGKIDLQDLKIRYRPNAPLILKGITCTFQAGNRVGVVGRTGSGKTTLISALFRLVEPDGGRILIDDLDICSMGLKDLRMKLSIIPQEPTLFRGSIRSNLDPLGLHSDHEIWEALEKCQLASTIHGLPNHLDSSVSDDGENWSAGQRQLFCLGRVLLKRNRILVLDEATASIDSATDAVLQRVIRQEFAGCTVITVAHRVPTVTDSDMVLVLSYGKLIEYDKPSKLMETDSSFSRLVAEYWSNCKRNPMQNQSSFH